MPMILQGRYLSPFARRVAVTLNLYGMSFEQQEIAIAEPDDLARLTQYNPLGRIPALILEDGRAMIDSGAILDYLDEAAGPEKRLTPASGPTRAEVLQLLSLITGTMERAMFAFYETDRRPPEYSWPQQAEKLRGFASDGLAALEAALTTADGEWFVGNRMTQADVSGAVAYDFVSILHPGLVAGNRYPALATLTARMSAMPEFASTYPNV